MVATMPKRHTRMSPTTTTYCHGLFDEVEFAWDVNVEDWTSELSRSRRREDPSLSGPEGQCAGQENSFMWKSVGKTNAREVLKRAPMRAMKRPKEGMAMARISASKTSPVLRPTRRKLT